MASRRRETPLSSKEKTYPVTLGDQAFKASTPDQQQTMASQYYTECSFENDKHDRDGSKNYSQEGHEILEDPRMREQDNE